MTSQDPESLRQTGETPQFPRIYDLIREPSGAGILELISAYGKSQGKFVRFGNVVLIAPAIGLYPNGAHIVQHVDIELAGFDTPDAVLRQKVREATDTAAGSEFLKGEHGLVDAGGYSAVVLKAGTVASLSVFGESTDLGRADDTGRAETIEIFQAYMGPDIPVHDMG